MLQPFLEENRDRLDLLFLPAYSPQFNLVEALWKWLKADFINNVFYSTVAEIRRNVRGFLERISRETQAIIDRLCLRLEDGCLSGIL